MSRLVLQVGILGPLVAYGIGLVLGLLLELYQTLVGGRETFDADDSNEEDAPDAWVLGGRRPRRGSLTVTIFFALLMMIGNAVALALVCKKQCPWLVVVVGGALAGAAIGKLFAFVARGGYLFLPLLVLPFVINAAAVWLVTMLVG
jgi:hypothetical protein